MMELKNYNANSIEDINIEIKENSVTESDYNIALEILYNSCTEVFPFEVNYND